MLFDLRGRRRRAVQATYLTLAVLMGGGLVLFGIGGDVSGGLFDAFKGGQGSPADQQAQKRVKSNQKVLARNPEDKGALKALVRDEISLANSQRPQSSLAYPAKAKKDLLAASSYWQRYLRLEKGRPDAALAAVAVAMYDPGALNDPKQAQQAATILAEAQKNTFAYIKLVTYATLAGDKRTADLAAQKAVDLAPANAKKSVRAQVTQARQQAQAFKAQSAGAGAKGGGARTTP
jgi:hypothetical protein